MLFHDYMPFSMCMIFYFTILLPSVPNPSMCVYTHSCTQYFPNMSYVKLMNFPFDLIPPRFLISSRYLAHDWEGVRLI